MQLALGDSKTHSSNAAPSFRRWPQSSGRPTVASSTLPLHHSPAARYLYILKSKTENGWEWCFVCHFEYDGAYWWAGLQRMFIQPLFSYHFYDFSGRSLDWQPIIVTPSVPQWFLHVPTPLPQGTPILQPSPGVQVARSSLSSHHLRWFHITMYWMESCVVN